MAPTTNAYSNTSISASIHHATTFLAYPLHNIFDVNTMSILQAVLASSFHVAFMDSPALSLTLSPLTLPPRPIHAASIAAGVSWAQWMAALGNGEFELCITPTEVVIRVAGIMQDHEITVWKAQEQVEQVPISKLSRQSASVLAPLQLGIQRRTLAQQLIESDEEGEEEMFRLISSGIVSPTPTREVFPSLRRMKSFDTVPLIAKSSNSFQVETSTPSPPSSRPSSRSSMTSTDSHFSYSSSEESMTSVSSTSSFAVVKPTIYVPPQHKTPVFGKPSFPPVAPRLAATSFTPRCALHTPSKMSTPQLLPFKPTTPRVDADKASNVIIDTSRKPTSYLYQGGRSTVLTGGVMLGGAPSKVKVEQPKYRAPIGARRTRGEAGTWRRSAMHA
ncbi:hypothetical protein BDQ12DRAFT_714660 [Crucibulum laeve]|uniref:Anti-proliferative protein domain-containing protein n=1 Tax=Crucibulum laeve TaxID=68775 RepID=A0A5C3LRA6_9AGAR|nr:hypothetical protein BDQ12DRAFT_714660 [Crucibulum laeve]